MGCTSSCAGRLPSRKTKYNISAANTVTTTATVIRLMSRMFVQPTLFGRMVAIPLLPRPHLAETKYTEDAPKRQVRCILGCKPLKFQTYSL